MITKVHDNVWKVSADSNVYLLEKERVVIDTGNRAQRTIIDQFLSKVINFEFVDAVIFTHLHYDHIGNFDLFPNATFYASKKEIEDFKKRPMDTILNQDMVDKFKVDLHPIEKLKIDGLEIINAPGHTRGSICLFYNKEVLFTGDTIFNTCIGRIDLPTSAPKKMQDTLNRLVTYQHKVICAGHDY